MKFEDAAMRLLIGRWEVRNKYGVTSVANICDVEVQGSLTKITCIGDRGQFPFFRVIAKLLGAYNRPRTLTMTRDGSGQQISLRVSPIKCKIGKDQWAEIVCLKEKKAVPLVQIIADYAIGTLVGGQVRITDRLTEDTILLIVDSVTRSFLEELIFKYSRAFRNDAPGQNWRMLRLASSTNSSEHMLDNREFLLKNRPSLEISAPGDQTFYIKVREMGTSIELIPQGHYRIVQL